MKNKAQRPDTVVGTDQRTKSGCRAAELEGDEDFFLARQAEPSVFLLNGQPEQTDLSHFRDNLCRNLIVVRNIPFGWDQPFTDISIDGSQQIVEELSITDHRRKLGGRFSRNALPPSFDSSVS